MVVSYFEKIFCCHCLTFEVWRLSKCSLFSVSNESHYTIQKCVLQPFGILLCYCGFGLNGNVKEKVVPLFIVLSTVMVPP